MLVWFVALIALGAAAHRWTTRRCWRALNPLYALRFIVRAAAGSPSSRWARWCWCVTGGEALYADMGHFGKQPIRIAWFGLVMPALVLNYFGQGALLLQRPEAVDNPFYLMAPDVGRLLPLVVLATAATVIASQALIIGGVLASPSRRSSWAILPRMRIQHTSVRETGQIYVPLVNWLLFVVIVLAVACSELVATWPRPTASRSRWT